MRCSDLRRVLATAFSLQVLTPKLVPVLVRKQRALSQLSPSHFPGRYHPKCSLLEL